MKRASLIGFLLLVLITVTGCGNADPDAPDTIELRLASVLPEDHPSSQALKFMKDRLATASDGRLDLQLFFNSQLGQETETIEMTQTGTIEMLFISCAPMTQFVPELNALTMPFIFRDSVHQYRVVDGPVGARFRDMLAEKALQVLCFFDAGSRNIMTKQGPITTPDDLKNLDIRVMGSPLMVATVNALGATAVPMPQGEVYTALQTGNLDGWENNPPTALTFKMYETGCTYYARTQHLMIPDLLIINTAVYEDLPPELRTVLDDVARETTEKQRQLWTAAEQDTIAILKEEGMTFNDVQKDLFIDRVEPVYADMYKKYGASFEDICEQIRNTE